MLRVLNKQFSTSAITNYKVTVCGASGSVGQSLSLLLKNNPLVSEINLYDIANTVGIATDLSHIETPTKVKSSNNLMDSLKNAHIVVIVAGVSRKPGTTHDSFLEANAKIIEELIQPIPDAAPEALIGIITNPMNSIVPVACEVLHKIGKLDPRRIFGISTLNIVRANTFLSEIKRVDPKDVKVPVVGGHSGITIIPLISRTTPSLSLEKDEIVALTKRIQDAGKEIIKAKGGQGSAALSMAYAGATFINSLLRALKGEPGITQHAYVMSSVTQVPFFTTPLLLDNKGIRLNFGLGILSDYEHELLDLAIPELQKDIQAGIDYVHNKTKLL